MSYNFSSMFLTIIYKHFGWIATLYYTELPISTSCVLLLLFLTPYYPFFCLLVIRITQKVLDRLPWNLVEGCSVSQERTQSILAVYWKFQFLCSISHRIPSTYCGRGVHMHVHKHCSVVQQISSDRKWRTLTQEWETSSHLRDRTAAETLRSDSLYGQ